MVGSVRTQLLTVMNAPAMKVSLELTVKLVSALVKHLNLKFYPDMTSYRFNSKQLKFNSNQLLYLLKCRVCILYRH